MILVDAGPLVALLDRSDPYHGSCTRVLGSLREPRGTVWPVVAEAMYLLRFSWRAQDALWEMLERGTVALISLDTGDHSRMRALMHQYRDLPMDLADAALVRVAERENLSTVFTLDRRDFEVYRPLGIGVFSIIPS